MPPLPLSNTFSAIAGTSAMNGAAKNVFRHIASALIRRPGSRLTKRKPSRIDRTIPRSRASATGPGNVSVSSTATTARKLTAFTPSAHA